jgi:hypothetical protein
MEFGKAEQIGCAPVRRDFFQIPNPSPEISSPCRITTYESGVQMLSGHVAGQIVAQNLRCVAIKHYDDDGWGGEKLKKKFFCPATVLDKTARRGEVGADGG